VDPKWNLAIEEAVLRARRDDACQDTLWIWRNEKSVVVGCSSKIESEVNLDECKRFGVEVVRRISGGGAVYNDLGNLNFSAIIKATSCSVPQDTVQVYELLAEPVVGALEDLGLVPEYQQPNSILLDGKKVSGMAQHWMYDAILLHGTLLVNADLWLLKQVLRELKSDVVNLSLETKNPIDATEVRKVLYDAFQRFFDTEFKEEGLTASEATIAKNLFDLKYSRRKWNIGEEESLIPIELCIANPPTSSCKHLVDIAEEVAREFHEKVRLTIKQIDIVSATGYSRSSIVPALRVNGQLVFSRHSFSKEGLRTYIAKELNRVQKCTRRS